MRKPYKRLIDDLGWLSILILREAVIQRKITTKQIKYALERYFEEMNSNRRQNFIKNISYAQCYKEIDRLVEHKLLVVLTDHPVILQINPEHYADITSFLEAYYRIENMK